MTAYANKTTGDWSAAATWGAIEATTWQPLLSSQETTDTVLTKNTWVATSVFTTSATDKSVDAVLLKYARNDTSPVGTVSVRIYDVTGAAVVAGTTVTVNAANLPNTLTSQSPTWLAFEFASAVTLPGGGANQYRIEVNHIAASGTPAVYFKTRTSPINGWSFGLRLNRTGVPTTTDQVIVTGSYLNSSALTARTVRHNANVTVGTSTTGHAAIEICHGGTLTTDKTGATTLALTLNGNLVVSFGGTVDFGTAAAPLPSTSTLTVTLNSASAQQYGVNARHGTTFSVYGAEKTAWTYLSANVAVAGTSLTTAVSTGWNAGDVIAIASTSRTNTQSELATMSTNAVGTSISLTAGVGFAHEGSAIATNVRAEVINLTRNVKIVGATTTNTATFNLTGNVTCTLGWVEFYKVVSIANGSSGLGYGDPTLIVTGAANRDVFFNTIYLNSVAISKAVMFLTTAVGSNSALNFYLCALNTRTISESCFIHSSSSSSNWILYITSAFDFLAVSNSTMVGFQNNISVPAIYDPAGGHFYTNCETRCSRSSNVQVNFSTYVSTKGFHTFNNLICRRSAGDGMAVSQARGLLVQNSSFSGNSSAGVTLISGSQIRFENCTFGGETGYATTYGVQVSSGATAIEADFESCTFGTPVATSNAGFTTISGSSLYSFAKINLRNCAITTAKVSILTNLYEGCGIAFTNFNNVVGDNRLFKRGGYSTPDTTYTALAGSIGERLYPTVTAASYNPIRTNPKQIPIPSGKKARIGVSLRRSTVGDGRAYTGTVQLIMSRNWQGGQLTDYLVLATSSGSAGVWERLTADTPTVTADCIAEVYILAYGNAATPTPAFLTTDYWTAEIV